MNDLFRISNGLGGFAPTPGTSYPMGGEAQAQDAASFTLVPAQIAASLSMGTIGQALSQKLFRAKDIRFAAITGVVAILFGGASIFTDAHEGGLKDFLLMGLGGFVGGFFSGQFLKWHSPLATRLLGKGNLRRILDIPLTSFLSHVGMTLGNTAAALPNGPDAAETTLHEGLFTIHGNLWGTLEMGAFRYLKPLAGRHIFGFKGDELLGLQWFAGTFSALFPVELLRETAGESSSHEGLLRRTLSRVYQLSAFDLGTGVFQMIPLAKRSEMPERHQRQIVALTAAIREKLAHPKPPEERTNKRIRAAMRPWKPRSPSPLSRIRAELLAIDPNSPLGQRLRQELPEGRTLETMRGEEIPPHIEGVLRSLLAVAQHEAGEEREVLRVLLPIAERAHAIGKTRNGFGELLRKAQELIGPQPPPETPRGVDELSQIQAELLAIDPKSPLGWRLRQKLLPETTLETMKEEDISPLVVAVLRRLLAVAKEEEGEEREMLRVLLPFAERVHAIGKTENVFGEQLRKAQGLIGTQPLPGTPRGVIIEGEGPTEAVRRELEEDLFFPIIPNIASKELVLPKGRRLRFTGKVFGQGSAATVYEAIMTSRNGRPKRVAVKIYDHVDGRTAGSTLPDHILQEIQNLRFAERNGLGRVQYFGSGTIDGMEAFVTNVAPGESWRTVDPSWINQRTFREMNAFFDKIGEFGLDPSDLQFHITRSGRIYLIDVAGPDWVWPGDENRPYPPREDALLYLNSRRAKAGLPPIEGARGSLKKAATVEIPPWRKPPSIGGEPIKLPDELLFNGQPVGEDLKPLTDAFSILAGRDVTIEELKPLLEFDHQGFRMGRVSIHKGSDGSLDIHVRVVDGKGDQAAKVNWVFRPAPDRTMRVALGRDMTVSQKRQGIGTILIAQAAVAFRNLGARVFEIDIGQEGGGMWPQRGFNFADHIEREGALVAFRHYLEMRSISLTQEEEARLSQVRHSWELSAFEIREGDQRLTAGREFLSSGNFQWRATFDLSDKSQSWEHLRHTLRKMDRSFGTHLEALLPGNLGLGQLGGGSGFSEIGSALRNKFPPTSPAGSAIAAASLRTLKKPANTLEREELVSLLQGWIREVGESLESRSDPKAIDEGKAVQQIFRWATEDLRIGLEEILTDEVYPHYERIQLREQLLRSAQTLLSSVKNAELRRLLEVQSQQAPFEKPLGEVTNKDLPRLLRRTLADLLVIASEPAPPEIQKGRLETLREAIALIERAGQAGYNLPVMQDPSYGRAKGLLEPPQYTSQWASLNLAFREDGVLRHVIQRECDPRGIRFENVGPDLYLTILNALVREADPLIQVERRKEPLQRSDTLYGEVRHLVNYVNTLSVAERVSLTPSKEEAALTEAALTRLEEAIAEDPSRGKPVSGPRGSITLRGETTVAANHYVGESTVPSFPPPPPPKEPGGSTEKSTTAEFPPRGKPRPIVGGSYPEPTELGQALEERFGKRAIFGGIREACKRLRKTPETLEPEEFRSIVGRLLDLIGSKWREVEESDKPIDRGLVLIAKELLLIVKWGNDILKTNLLSEEDSQRHFARLLHGVSKKIISPLRAIQRGIPQGYGTKLAEEARELSALIEWAVGKEIEWAVSEENELEGVRYYSNWLKTNRSQIEEALKPLPPFRRGPGEVKSRLGDVDGVLGEIVVEKIPYRVLTRADGSSEYRIAEPNQRVVVLGDVGGFRTAQLLGDGHTVFHIDLDPGYLGASRRTALRLLGLRTFEGMDDRVNFVRGNWFDTDRDPSYRADWVEAYYPLDINDLPPRGNPDRPAALIGFLSMLVSKLGPNGKGIFLISERDEIVRDLAELVRQDPHLKLVEEQHKKVSKPPITGGHGQLHENEPVSWIIFRRRG